MNPPSSAGAVQILASPESADGREPGGPLLPPAAEITRRARSNLAAAFVALPADRRRDAVTFYAFCRWVDDLADDEAFPAARRRQLLERWLHGARHGFSGLPGGAQPLERELDAVVERRGVDRERLAEIVEGMLEDLDARRFGTVAAVEAYNWKVASCVGLVSIRIFGCTQPESEVYAVELGQALQWTNILRDVGEDWRQRQRLYLPEQELARHLLTDRDIAAGQQDGRFQALMQSLAARARGHFEAAKAARTPEDRRCLAAAEAMRQIYSALLEEMERDGFRVFEKRYAVPRWKKLWLLLAARWAG